MDYAQGDTSKSIHLWNAFLCCASDYGFHEFHESAKTLGTIFGFAHARLRPAASGRSIEHAPQEPENDGEAGLLGTYSWRMRRICSPCFVLDSRLLPLVSPHSLTLRHCHSFLLKFSSMQFFAKLTLVAAAAASILGAVARPMNTTIATRAAAKVITKCTKPNTAALTYAGLSRHPNAADTLR